MTYSLYIGDRTFSSWSLRGWLMLEKFGLPYHAQLVGLYDGTMADDMAPLAPARLVPTLKTPEGTVISDSLAIAETLAERHPDAGLWPTDPVARAHARWLCAEMHAGFTALRNACPMQLEHRYSNFEPGAAVLKDLARIQELWDMARTHAPDGPWLFGSYSLVDVFYAPVAARIAGYSLPVGETAQAYVARHLADPAFKTWRATGLKTIYDPFPYGEGLSAAPWPEPL